MEFDDFQNRVLDGLAKLLDAKGYRILEKSSPPQPFGNSFIRLAIRHVSVEFSFDRGDTIVFVGRLDEASGTCSRNFLIERVLRESIGRSIDDYCALLESRFPDLESAFSNERFSETVARLDSDDSAAQRFAEL